jgi:hypothetical protein
LLRRRLLEHMGASAVPSIAAMTSALAPPVIMFSSCETWSGILLSAYCRSTL